MLSKLFLVFSSPNAEGLRLLGTIVLEIKVAVQRQIYGHYCILQL